MVLAETPGLLHAAGAPVAALPAEEVDVEPQALTANKTAPTTAAR
jgi:hypothetical protein